ncbi:hypothetical protein GCM10009555_050230 [Acrocarpospora macrocephala]|uniref:Terpene synthase n=1 Tax=Acrocarpospora macrocephala TaxID=150177 RepID=A0A5M3WWT5_9ACTN|nr:terpene synthase family protein [Acrocarpospora macrocephala]GES12856.1 hypothetical protein Amac_064530 [Acrocarpospora macrocephala]
MTQQDFGVDQIAAAAEHGRICALAADCQRDLQKCAARYPELLPGSPFDPRFFSTVSLANAFGSPWLPADRLRIANRTCLWISGADWMVDYLATSRDEIQAIVRGCLAVAHGAPADTPLSRFLADLRDDLRDDPASAPAFAVLEPVWREELERYLSAEAREWDWKKGSSRPDVEEYLENSDNFGTSLVNVWHWIFTSSPGSLAHLDELRAASRKVGHVLRLLNDLASAERDLKWGDINILTLGPGRADVTARIAELMAECRTLIRPLKDSCHQEAVYLERQLGYSTGFYGITDYWGEV